MTSHRGRSSRPALLSALIVGLAAGAAHGQALDLTFDFNTPVASVENGGRPAAPDAGLGFTVGLYNRPLDEPDHPWRFGLVVGRRSATNVASWNGSTYRYSIFDLMFGIDRRVTSTSWLSLTAGVDWGLGFLNDNVPCDAFTCGLPESMMVFQPRMKAAVRLSDTMSALLVCKGIVYNAESPGAFPFASGWVMAAGFAFRGVGRTAQLP